MAHPASARADGPEPHSTGPGDPGTAAYRTAVTNAASQGRLIIELMAAYPGDPRFFQLAGAILESLQVHEDIGRRCVIDQSILEAERKRAYEQGVADCKAARCRLTIVPDVG